MSGSMYLYTGTLVRSLRCLPLPRLGAEEAFLWLLRMDAPLPVWALHFLQLLDE